LRIVAKVPISFIMSVRLYLYVYLRVRLSVRMCERGSQWTDFREI